MTTKETEQYHDRIHQKNQEAKKAFQEMNRIPHSLEQRDRQINQMFRNHNQVNPNKKIITENTNFESNTPTNGIQQQLPQGINGTENKGNSRIKKASDYIRTGTSESIGDAQADSREISDREAQIAEEYAKENGIWLVEKNIVNSATRRLPSGKEADVYYNESIGSLLKVVNYKQYSKTPIDFINNRILLYNKLFAETPYDIVGFTETDKGLAFVLSQPFVDGNLLENEVDSFEKDEILRLAIDNYMLDRLGMKPDGLYAYSNELYKVQDLHLKNVMRGEDGKLYVIDAIPSEIV